MKAFLPRMTRCGSPTGPAVTAKRLQVGEAKVKVRPEQDQRPEGRGHYGREHLGKAAEMGVVAVLGGDDHADHHIDDEGQTGHPIRFAGHGRAPPTAPRPTAGNRGGAQYAGTG